MSAEKKQQLEMLGSSVFPEPRIRRNPIWTRLSLGALLVFEVVMLVWFLVASAKSRPDSFIGLWIAGSGVLVTLLAIAQGMTASDFTRAITMRGFRYRIDDTPDPNRWKM
jgi:hypothetical protein